MGAPATLPADFSDWDQEPAKAAPAKNAVPDTLPADFQGWDPPKPDRFASVKETANRAIDTTLGAANKYVAEPVIRARDALNQSLADVPKVFSEPVEVPPGVTGSHEALYRANEGVRRVGRLASDLLAPAMAPFSVATAPAEPAVQPYAAAASNILNATAGGQVRPDLENPAESGPARLSRILQTPGAVQQQNPNAQAINEFVGGTAPYLPFGITAKGAPSVEGLASEVRVGMPEPRPATRKMATEPPTEPAVEPPRAEPPPAPPKPAEAAPVEPQVAAAEPAKPPTPAVPADMQAELEAANARKPKAAPPRSPAIEPGEPIPAALTQDPKFIEGLKKRGLEIGPDGRVARVDEDMDLVRQANQAAAPAEAPPAPQPVERRAEDRPPVAGPAAAAAEAERFMREQGLTEEPQVEQVHEPQGGLSPAGSGTTHLSNEELARQEKFYKIDGTTTYLGKQPDASLRPGEAVVGVGPGGETRIVNQNGPMDEAHVAEKIRAAGGQPEQVGAARPGAKTLKREIEMVPRSTISVRADEMQPRRGTGKYRTNPDQVEALTENMKAHGFDPTKPLKVWEDPKTGELVLMEGHHRLEAAEKANIENVPIEIAHGSYEQAKAQARRSNSQMAPMGPMELAGAFQKEADAGHTPAEISKLYGGMKENEVEDLLRLNKLEPSLQREVQRGLFDVPRAVALAKAVEKHGIPPQIQREAFEYVARDKDITAGQFTKLLDTFAPQAVEQAGLDFGPQGSLDGMPTSAFKGMRSVLDEYLGKLRALTTSQRRLQGFLKEAERMEREGTADKALIATRRKMEAEVRRLQQELEAKQKEVAEGKVFKTLGQAIDQGKASAAPERGQEPIVSPLEGETRQAALGEAAAEGNRVPAVEAPKRPAGDESGTGRLPVVEQEKPTRQVGAEAEPTLPGMEPHVEAQKAAAGEEIGRQLTQELASPKGDISGKAGELEIKSPLFRDSEASGQGGLFGKQEPEVSPPGEEGKGTRLFSGAVVADPQVWKELFPSVSDTIGKAIDRVTDKDLTSEDLEKGVLRAKRGALDQKKEQLYTELRSYAKAWDKRSAADSRAFIDSIESGKIGELAGDDRALAERLRQMLDQRRDRIRALKPGALQHFIKDYFPHLWENPSRASKVFQQILGSKRPFQGPASFLKKRTIPTFEEGIEKGLSPVTYNPVDLALLKLHEMDRFIYAHESLAEMKKIAADPKKADNPNALKLATYADVNSTREKLLQRLGWKKYEDRVGTVYSSPEIPLSEYHDKNAVTALEDTLDNLGVEHDRGLKHPAKSPKALGMSHQGADYVETRFATPMAVLSHELGHQADYRWNLGDELVNNKKYKKELRLLSDLTYEGTDPSMVPDSFKKYVRSKPEKIAHIFEAWLGARERLKEIAPQTYDYIKGFLQEHEELHPLLNYKPTLAYEERADVARVKGMVIRGYFWGPPEAVGVFNRNLSPGLTGRSRAFDLYRGASNAMNAAQLGISAFHLGFTSLDSATSDVALGIEQLSRLNPQGVKAIARGLTFTSPFENALVGNRVLKEYLKPGSYTDYSKLAKAVAEAGGRAYQDPFYSDQNIRGFRTAIKDGRYGTAAARLLPATIEAAAKPIMEYVVPRQKLGVFAKMAGDVLERAASEKWEPPKVRNELQKAWDSVDNRLGQMVYDNLFWHRTVKDLGLASTRSLGWNLGTVREILGGVKDTGVEATRKLAGKEAEITHRMAYIMALPVVAGFYGAIYHYLSTGQAPESAKDYFFPKNPAGNRVSLPSYMKDIYAWRHHPLETLGHKVNPLASEIVDMLKNRDFYGNEIRNQDDPIVSQAAQAAKYGLKQFLPFSVRNAMQRARETGDTSGTGFLKPSNLAKSGQSFVGITPAPSYINHTPAEELESQYNQRNRGEGTRTTAQAAIHDRRGTLLQQLKAGTLDKEGLLEKIRAGEVTAADAKYAWQAHKNPSIVRGFQDLPIEQAMKVYAAASPEEQQQLRRPMARKVRQLRNRTPEERGPLLEQWKRIMGRPTGEPEVQPAEY